MHTMSTLLIRGDEYEMTYPAAVEFEPTLGLHVRVFHLHGDEREMSDDEIRTLIEGAVTWDIVSPRTEAVEA